MNHITKDLMAVSGVPLILLVIKESGESYGYEIAKKIRELSDDKIIWKDGSLYPVLKKLEKKEWIRSIWRYTQANKKRKYYAITEKGKIELIRLLNEWFMVNNSLKALCSKDTIGNYINENL
jgi:PadR family transcriptional regulator, regulatory protein PadR